MHKNDFEELNIKYNRFIAPLYKDVLKMEITSENTDMLGCVIGLIEYAKRYDISQALKRLSDYYIGKVERDYINPKEFTDDTVIGSPWADDADNPLQDGEAWNKNARATNDGTLYETNEKGVAVCPYMDFGINGRGKIGLYGPNHAVDMGVLRIMKNKDGKETLHVLGIVRNDDGKRALCGGFTIFSKGKNGETIYDKKALIWSQTMEFFEEMVSGSVTLLPEYEQYIEKDFEQQIAAIELTRKKAVSEKEKDSIYKQTVTHYKVKQVKDKDPEFLARINKEFEKSTPCFTGAIIASTRNTNNAWMETRLTQFMMDEKKWAEIKGDNKFGYDFVAGDDAGGVYWHEITPETLADTTGGHAPYMGYLLASYVANTVSAGKDLSPDIANQVDDVLRFFVTQHTPQIRVKHLMCA